MKAYKDVVAPVGIEPTTTASGSTVYIHPSHAERQTSVERVFAHVPPRKHRRITFDPATAPHLIHSIASQVARVQPQVIFESNLVNKSGQWISNSANIQPLEIDRSHASTNHIIRITPPAWVPAAGMFRRNPVPKSANQARRWTAITKQRQQVLQERQSLYQNFFAPSANAFIADAKSTTESPIDLSSNLWLKFRVIDAVSRHTHVDVPAHVLGEIGDVNDLIEFVVSKQQELAAYGQRTKEKLPENVKFYFKDRVDRKSKPKWAKYQKLREESAVASV